MKKILTFFLLSVMILTITSCADATVRGSIYEITASGNAVTDRMAQKVLEILDIGVESRTIINTPAATIVAA